MNHCEHGFQGVAGAANRCVPAVRGRLGGSRGFSLVELSAVLVVLALLMMVGAGLWGGGGPGSRRAATELLEGMIDLARTSAITTRSDVMLVMAEPGDVAGADSRCRLGVFKTESWPDEPEAPVVCSQLGRWRVLDNGIALIGGNAEGMENPMDGRTLTIQYGGDRALTAKVHLITFNPRGGIRYPSGSSPVVLRVAEASYRAGKVIPCKRGPDSGIAETLLKIGRVIARSNRIN